MSGISILVFSSPEPPTSTSRTSSTSSVTTLSDYDFALLLTPRPARLLLPFHRPIPLLYTRNNPNPIPASTSPHQPILKIHIAATKASRLPTLLNRLTSTIPPDTPSQEHLTLLLQALQKATLVPRFNIPKFQQFVLDSLHKRPLSARRPSSSGTTEIDYLALLSSNAEVKKMLSPEPEADEAGERGVGAGQRTFCGFRISSGGREKVLTNRMVAEWERRDDPYGGLM